MRTGAFAIVPALAVLICLGATAAQKPAENKIPAPAANAPIQVSSDTFLADSNAKTGTWAGNVIITQGDIKMHADSVRMDVAGKNDQPSKIYAKGHVVVDSPASGTATGDEGVYDVVPRLVTLTGHVVLARDKDVMRGTQLTVNLLTGHAQLGAKGVPGGRVQGLFAPPPQSPPPSPSQSPDFGARK